MRDMDIASLRELAVRCRHMYEKWSLGVKGPFLLTEAEAAILALLDELDEAAQLLDSFAPLTDDNSPVRKWLARHEDAG